jgi:DNA-binding CsgD family transcriptional regulator
VPDQPRIEQRQLTPRQGQVLDLIVREGLSTKQIGSRLGLAETTAKTHVNALLRIFGVSKREQLVIAIYRRADEVRRAAAEQAVTRCGSCPAARQILAGVNLEAHCV